MSFMGGWISIRINRGLSEVVEWPYGQSEVFPSWLNGYRDILGSLRGV